MTPDDLEAIMAKASPMPWKRCGASDGKCKCGLVWSIPEDRVVAAFSADEQTNAGERDWANAAAVEGLRNLAPALLRLWRAAALVRGDLWTMPDLPPSVIQNAYELDEALSELENHR